MYVAEKLNQSFLSIMNVSHCVEELDVEFSNSFFMLKLLCSPLARLSEETYLLHQLNCVWYHNLQTSEILPESILKIEHTMDVQKHSFVRPLVAVHSTVGSADASVILDHGLNAISLRV